MRLLLVEDEVRLATSLQRRLTREGFAVDCVGHVCEAETGLTAVPYDIAVIDLRLPDGDGLNLIATARRQGLSLPILVLTARDAVSDRVAGLDAGADDYLVKPFATAELVARIKALLRRPGEAFGTVLTAGRLALDTTARQASVGDRPLALSRQQVALLEQLLRRLGQVVPREVLEDKLYAFDRIPESNPIPVHVHNLRRQLTTAQAAVEIHTVRGVGYLLVEA